MQIIRLIFFCFFVIFFLPNSSALSVEYNPKVKIESKNQLRVIINRGHLKDINIIHDIDNRLIATYSKYDKMVKNFGYTRALSTATAMQLLKIASGSSIFTASQSVEAVIEGYKGHGLFTYTLIEGDERYGRREQ